VTCLSCPHLFCCGSVAIVKSDMGEFGDLRDEGDGDGEYKLKFGDGLIG